jgi:hypothetical protein
MSMGDEELIILQRKESAAARADRHDVPTRCIVKRDVPLVFKATNKKGLGAAYTAVLEKFRFPRINCRIISDHAPSKLLRTVPRELGSEPVSLLHLGPSQ